MPARGFRLPTALFPTAAQSTHEANVDLEARFRYLLIVVSWEE
jgi:hypothetical protein